VVVGKGRGKREHLKKKEEERADQTVIWDNGASLVGALQRYKGIREAGALPADVARLADPTGLIRRHHPFYASEAPGWLAPCA
jgi:hypothetical protein